MKEIWIDDISLAELYKNDSVVCKLRTEIQSIGKTLLVEADLDLVAEIFKLQNRIKELEQKK